MLGMDHRARHSRIHKHLLSLCLQSGTVPDAVAMKSITAQDLLSKHRSLRVKSSFLPSHNLRSQSFARSSSSGPERQLAGRTVACLCYTLSPSPVHTKQIRQTT